MMPNEKKQQESSQKPQLWNPPTETLGNQESQNGKTATENKERSATTPQQRREERHASTVEKQDIS
jgi:hypothetical protein